jgi:hypothetical protein
LWGVLIVFWGRFFAWVLAVVFRLPYPFSFFIGSARQSNRGLSVPALQEQRGGFLPPLAVRGLFLFVSRAKHGTFKRGFFAPQEWIFVYSFSFCSCSICIRSRSISCFSSCSVGK